MTDDALMVGGRKVDGRTLEARRFKAIAGDLIIQLGRGPTASERALLYAAATFAMLCERDTESLLAGQGIDQENYRRNVAMLGQQLVKLGMAKKSRDVTKRDHIGMDDFGAALIEANKI
ncbi:hypothetical protein [Sphingobium sp. KCTC 72723]|uniref:hypothetical protein n=1 Tax=Sphingobium sp. KCTC 72723 TaxID=2733867 RepID=UPI00165E9BAD|nr:hypothetical protein [Sphingobium sp. KCTC 72723]